jgi:hypothetical protein
VAVLVTIVPVESFVKVLSMFAASDPVPTVMVPRLVRLYTAAAFPFVLLRVIVGEFPRGTVVPDVMVSVFPTFIVGLTVLLITIELNV